MITTITCAFCGGKKKDPFDLLSPVSYCLVCKGSGKVEVEEPVTRCIFCSGTGKNPLGARVACIVCGGKGYYPCKSSLICSSCKGSGKSNDGLPCPRCCGKGFEGA